MGRGVPHAVVVVVSVTFRVLGDRDDDNIVNVSNANARDVLNALDVPGADAPDLCGGIAAADLARLCMIFVNSAEPDPASPGVELHGVPGRARLVECGRRAGYLRDVAGRLWRLALAAGPGGEIAWD
jgi:hypothetical protein